MLHNCGTLPYNANNPVITTDQKYYNMSRTLISQPPPLEEEEEEEEEDFTSSRGYGSYILGHRMKVNMITILSSIFVVLVM